MKHAGAEPQRRLNVHRQPCRAVEVSEARQRRQRERGGDPARGAKHTAQHPFKSLPFRLPGQSQRFGVPTRSNTPLPTPTEPAGISPKYARNRGSSPSRSSAAS